MFHPPSDLATGSAASTASHLPAAEPAAPESTIPSPRALVARRALLGAAILGILADPLLRNEPWGLGLLVWMVMFATIAIALVRQKGRSLSLESSIWLSVALLFAAGLSWRDAAMLQFFDVLAMLTALVLLAMSIDAIPVPSLALARVRDLIRAAFGTGLDVATGVVPLLMRDAELHTALRPSNDGCVRRIGRALVITAPIILIFTLLLTHADPVFGSFFTFWDVDIGVVLSHVVVAGFFAWVVAGWLRRSLLAHPEGAGTPATPLPLTLGATDVTVALGALNLLFAAFVVVQIGWLFGGEALVLRTTGLSYADYARRGFFELTLVAGLLLPLLLGAQALIPLSDFRTLRLYRRLAVSLVVLLGVILLSAGVRMRLYVQYYGISTDRLYATAFMIWLAIVFVWLVFTVLRSRPRTFATGLVVSGFVVLLTLNILNPDALVARANLARGDAGRTGAARADLRYVASLGGDAVPVLVSALTAPDIAVDKAAAGDRGAAANILLVRWTGERHARMARHWTQWNIARRRASRAVRAHEAELRQLADTETPAEAVMEKLQGTWQLVYQEMNGRKLPDEQAAEMFNGKMVFAGDKIRYSVELPGFDFEFAYKLHTNQQPKAIDLTLTDVSDKQDIGKKSLGIYLLEKDTLKICYNDTKRPTDFDAGKGSTNVLIVLKRSVPASTSGRLRGE